MAYTLQQLQQMGAKPVVSNPPAPVAPPTQAPTTTPTTQAPQKAYTLDELTKIGAQPVQSTPSAPVSQETPQPKKSVFGKVAGFVTDVAKDAAKTLIVNPAIKAGQATAAMGLKTADFLSGGAVDRFTQEKTGQSLDDRLNVATKENIETPVGTIEGQKDFGQGGAKQIAGEALKTASYLYGAGGAAPVAKEVGKKAFVTAIKQGAKTGAITGGEYATGQALTEGKSVTDALTEGAIGATAGAAIGGAIPGVGAIASNLKSGTASRAGSKLEKIITKRESELFDIENNYVKGRKIMDASKDAGTASRKRIASTDVLVGAVDNEGRIRTKQPGGAVEKYRAETIDGAEKVVKKNLHQEGVIVNLKDVERKLLETIKNSDLEGGDLINAHSRIAKEIEGLRMRADSQGNIPLEKIHDAKVSVTKNQNYIDPADKNYRKSIGRGFKEFIEKNSRTNVKEVNSEIAKYLEDIGRLEALDGKLVKGGKLGKYFAQISGNMVGAVAGGAVGGPIGSAVGTVVGGEAGGFIKGKAMKSTFGKFTGMTGKRSEIIDKAIEKGNQPRLALPAPTSEFRSKVGSGATINLPSKSESTLEKMRSSNLGIKKPETGKITPQVRPSYEPYEKELPTIDMGAKPKKTDVLPTVKEPPKVYSNNFGKRKTTYKNTATTNKNSNIDKSITERSLEVKKKSTLGKKGGYINKSTTIAGGAVGSAGLAVSNYLKDKPKEIQVEARKPAIPKIEEKPANKIDYAINNATAVAEKTHGIKFPKGFLKAVFEQESSGKIDKENLRRSMGLTDIAMKELGKEALPNDSIENVFQNAANFLGKKSKHKKEDGSIIDLTTPENAAKWYVQKYVGLMPGQTRNIDGEKVSYDKIYQSFVNKLKTQ